MLKVKKNENADTISYNSTILVSLSQGNVKKSKKLVKMDVQLSAILELIKILIL